MAQYLYRQYDVQVEGIRIPTNWFLDRGVKIWISIKIIWVQVDKIVERENPENLK